MWDGTGSQLGVSENSVPLNPMVLLIIIPIKWLFHWEYTLFSDKPSCLFSLQELHRDQVRHKFACIRLDYIQLFSR